MNNIIQQMLQTKNWEELDKLIKNRVDEEKQNFGKGSRFFSLPCDSRDLTVHCTDEFLHPEYMQVYISTAYPVYSYYFDDEKEVYEMFAQELSKLENPADLNQIMSAVSETVFKYIGGVKNNGNDYTRLAKLKQSTEIGGDHNKFSVFKGSQDAWCTERACIAHQLFKFIGLDSKLVSTTISNNGDKQIHTFNLVKANDKTILFDSAVMAPPKENEKYNAVAYILPAEVYDKNMVDVAEIPVREIIGRSGNKYHITYDLQNRENMENARQL